MIIGGFKSGLESDVEVLGIGSDNPVHCDKPADLLTIKAGFGGGAFFNNLPTVCQGSSCASYSFQEAKWDAEYQLSTYRDGLRVVPINETAGWITGGKLRSSTEVLVSGKLTPGPELPQSLHFHCILRVNETHLFLAGGRDYEDTLSDAYLFDWPNQELQKMPGMAVNRDLHACALLNKPPWGIVMGGVNYTVQRHKTSEIFDLATESWSQGPNMPNGTELFGMQVVEYLDSFILVGGCPDSGSRDVYQFNPDNLEWIKRRETLASPRCDHVAFIIPNDACTVS